MKKCLWRAGLALSAAMVAALLGCSDFIQPDLAEKAAGNSATAYADAETLAQLAQDKRNVDWRVARFFALESLQNFRQANNWEDAQLSERPLIIHSAANGEPRYYEFRVVRKNDEIGAIACVVEKQEGDAVQYVAPFAHPISSSGSRSLHAKQGKLIDAGYPGNLLIRDGATGRSLNAGTGEEDTAAYPVDVKAKEFLEQLDPALYAEFGITSQDLYDKYIAQQIAEEARLSAYWERIETVKQEILSLSEEEILALFQDGAEVNRATSTLVSETYNTLPGWETKAGWPKLGGACGPAALTLITVGLGSKSGYTASVVPTTYNSSTSPAQIAAIYNNYVKKTGVYDGVGIDGAATFSKLDDALRSCTSYKIAKAAADLVHKWDAVYDHIKSAQLPAISLRTSIIGKSAPWHYRVIFGTCTQKYKESHSLLGIKWYDYDYVDWYYMWDNGSDGTCWWERDNQYYQLQTAKVYKK